LRLAANFFTVSLGCSLRLISDCFAMTFLNS
jgi:hypothetical protein